MGVAVVLDEFGMLEIIQPAALHRFPREREAGGVDDVDRHAEAGAESQHRAGVLGDVGLVEREVERDFQTLRQAVGKLAGGIVSHGAKVTLS
jgi:hypothetical protein